MVSKTWGVLYQLHGHEYCTDAKSILDESRVAQTCIEPAEIGIECTSIGRRAAMATGLLCGRRIGVLSGDYLDAASSLLSECGIRVLGIESRSPRTVHFSSDLTHVKLYVVSEDDIIEDLILEHLHQAGVDSVPRVHCKRRVNGLLVLLATSRVEGAPLASILIDDALKAVEGDRDGIKHLTRLLGSTLARIHDVMERCSYEWCRPRASTLEDVERWLYRLAYRRRLVEALYPRVGEDVGVYEILDALRYLEDFFRKNRSSLIGLRLIRGHGDLHLYQVYVEHDGKIIITDFEGEPYRDPARKDELEPAERDIAAVLRSLDYVAYLASQRADGDYTSSLRAWARSTARSFIEGYTSAGRSIGKWSLTFWLAERASYELVYELTAGTGLHSIPANALVSMRFKGPEAYLREILEDGRP